MIPLAYCGYSSKQQKHNSLFFKCYRFVIIDIKQYSNHSAYIHICTENIKKTKLQYIAVRLFLFLLINHPLFVSYVHITGCDERWVSL